MSKPQPPRLDRKKLFIYGLVLLLAILLRFIRYDQRWGLAYDQARDAIISREILMGKGVLPVGPFSSAGNFTTGPVWYWFLAVATAVFPPAAITPWVVLTSLFIVCVGLFMATGEIIGGTAMAVILGLFIAVSPAQINEGFNLINHSLVAVLSVLTVWASIRYLKTGKTVMLAVLALAAGCAFSAHYESALMAIFILMVFIFKWPTVKQILLFVALAILPFVPLILFDVRHNFYNLRGIIDYSRYGQYKIYIPNRWLTYAGVFIPYLWGTIIGGNNPFGYGLIILTAVACIIAWRNRMINRYVTSVLVGLAAMIFALRYYRGERFESYYVFLHPFVLIASAWACWVIWRKQAIIGVILVGAVTAASIIPTINSIRHAENYTMHQVNGWTNVLTTKYPGEKFDLYDFNYRSPAKSLPLVLFLNEKGLISPTGRPIGFGTPQKLERPFHLEITENIYGYDIWDLSASSSAVLQKNGWARINPADVYNGATNWYAKAATQSASQ